MRSLNKGKMLLAAAALLPLSVLEANPGFSRQMDMDCMACHNQTMSQLNSFGRKFAASGFTMTSGNQSMLDGNTIKLGLPSALNAGVLLKARYIQSEPNDDDGLEDVGTDRGSLEMYKVSKLFFGGKIAENVGGVGNYSYDSFGAKIVFVGELGSGYAGVSAFMDNSFGPFSGMEYYNTGLYVPLKLFENRRGTNAAQATNLGHGPATGIQAYYGGDVLFASAGAYVPATSEHEGLDIGNSAIGIGRIAVAPMIGDWMVMVGAYGLGGTARISDDALDNITPKADSSELIDITREAFGLDAQIEGAIGGMSTVVAVNAVLYNKTKLYNHSTGVNYDELSFNSGDVEYKAGDDRALSVEVQVNPWAAVGLKASYLHYDDRYDYKYSTAGQIRQKVDRADRDDYTLGVDYAFRQNVRFAFEYTYSDYRINDRLNQAGTDVISFSDGNNYWLYTMIGF